MEKMKSKNIEIKTEKDKFANTTRYYINDDFMVGISRVQVDLKDKQVLPNLWAKHGYIEKPISSYLCVWTCYTDKDGNGWGRYNITHTKDHKINFAWLLEATDENENKILNECIRLYAEDDAR